ncbi:hypothetical protein [Polaromonas sp. C04]|uniref:hypothetical protein n=1 Tax=Polaromonas sp. C04 TaxID=1945857 RepID=UPI0009841C7E|nr:hypothetical protein [Polaromonas sp. C04]OOG51611.1 hypothetical protein B0E49_15275 [Polaromonas sp. C04]
MSAACPGRCRLLQAPRRVREGLRDESGPAMALRGDVTYWNKMQRKIALSNNNLMQGGLMSFGTHGLREIVPAPNRHRHESERPAR